ncbi:MAG: prephenate dehydrogenase/arogenate dehydrogenase family protein [Firmicutes bacterium]|jgi:prephenate dehydrogenase|nr:prephenate dehydrogenase/arogenate dehydrogenase family protein [Candidatus Fermentithermobacillaceae bacterium]
MLGGLASLRVTIIGLGLIGGSLGQSLIESSAVSRVIGVDLEQTILDKALSKKAIHWGTADPVTACRDADIVILATPLRTMPVVAEKTLPHLKPGAIITDLGGAKQFMYNSMAKLLSSPACEKVDIAYAGCHPLTGTERSGIDAAEPDLFQGRYFVICPPVFNEACGRRGFRTDPIDILSNMANSIGAIPLYVDPAEHDLICAFTSHVEHLLAVSLLDGLNSISQSHPTALKMAAGSFKDATRVASSNPEMVTDMLITNAAETKKGLSLLIEKLTSVASLVESGDVAALKQHLYAAKALRDLIFGKMAEDI